MVESHQGRGRCWRGEREGWRGEVGCGVMKGGGGKGGGDEGERREGWGVMKVG